VYIKSIELTNVRGFHGARTVSFDLTRPDGTLAGRNG
jgi:hypothetical protein